ncbi:MAG: carboxypeptidase regulatory-like domain-containing protein [Clostridiales bacterium]|nr:carboxypeptidase regulatory-like domain-containing protein [Clostridiales bacterium]
MKVMKRVLACALAVMLAVPSVQAMASELPDNTAPESSAAAEEMPETAESVKTGTEVTAADENAGTEVPGAAEGAAEEPAIPEEVGEVPAVTEEPAATDGTEAPATTEEPAATDGTETPAATEEPAATDGTETPAATEEPAATDGTEVPTVTEETEAQAAEAPETAETEEPVQEAEPEVDEVQFNTGNHVWSVVNQEAFMELEMGDAYFEEDGSYTINIPEANPFFPYEVQFTHDGETTEEWFMNPEDTVEVGGHTFQVSAYIDNTVPTYMNLEVAGDTVAVYPQKKEFTDEEEAAAMPMSMIPLESMELSVDLSGYTPLELTMVKMSGIFENLPETAKVAWKRANYSSDNYTLSSSEDTIDLSWETSSNYNEWEMIVGDGDQLNPENIRYTVNINTTDAGAWLLSKAYAQDEQGNRSEVYVSESDYDDYYDDSAVNTGDLEGSRRQYTYYSSSEVQDKKLYTCLSIDSSLFGNSRIGSVKVVEGTYTDAADAAQAKDVTAQVLCADMTKASAGYSSEQRVTAFTMIGYDAAGTVIGILPFSWCRYGNVSELYVKLYSKTDTQTDQLASSWIYGKEVKRSFGLREPYALNGTYTLVMTYEKNSGADYPDVTAVYVGKYNSIAEATAAGAVNIKDSVMGDISSAAGYAADYSGGVWFTVFAGEDGNAKQSVYSFCAKTVRSTWVDSPDSDSTMDFYGLKDADGNWIPSYVISDADDSYAEKNYVTILVGENVDLSQKYAPVFSKASKATVYTEGSRTPEESGKTLHSFVGGPVQYSVSAEDGINSKNYWVQIRKAESADGQLYISSLKDEDAETRVENGVTYSIREVMLDAYHDYRHDICLANIGSTELPALSAELSSNVVELDPYWTLNGKQALAGMQTVERPDWSSDKEGELPNLAKLRLRAKDGVADGTEISGTLTIKSGDKVLMVLTLTGMVGDPCITTTEIPDAVKYVPYGTMIQNSNKYSWIQVSYELVEGVLPEGMEIRPNGELYGVPQETGSFAFTVCASFDCARENCNFPEQYADLTLTVQDNTDDNVYLYETDGNYTLETPIGRETAAGNHYFYLEQIADSLFVSEGVLPEFQNLWLNGEKLTAGTDYTAVSGSTRITVSAQTLQNKADKDGRNTIAAEFRVDGDTNKDLKRTAQNFYLTLNADGGDSGSNSGSSGGSGGSSDDDDDVSGSTGGGSSAPAFVTIRGHVVDGNSRAMAGYTVELHSTPRTTVTDGNGYFEFANVEYGTHELFVKDAAGNLLASRRFEIREGAAGYADDIFTAQNGMIVNMTVTIAGGAMTFSNVSVVGAQTGDTTHVYGWMLVLLVCSAALAGMAIYKKKRKLS